MDKKNPLLVPELKEMIEKGDKSGLKDFCEVGHPATIAEFLSPLSPKEVWEVLINTDPGRRVEIFCHLDSDLQVQMVRSVKREEIVLLLTDMPHDDRADLFSHISEDLREALLRVMARAEREDIRQLLNHKEGTAGSVMTSDYATLSPKMTASQALEHLRKIAPNKETIYYNYVVDDQRRLLGFVSLKDLIVSGRETLIENLMDKEFIFSRVEDDQEEAARKIQKYDLLALPVLDGGDVLVGIITHDDALDVITQEHTEDMEKFMAIAGSHEEAVYMKTSVWVHFKNRYPWILVLAVLGMVSGFIVQNFEVLLTQFVILAAFMPMLADTGGNIGSQSATLVIRALALKEISTKDLLRILGKEIRVALLLAFLLGIIAFGRVMVFGGGSLPPGFSLLRIGTAISTALFLQVIISTLVGVILPMGAAKLKLDPAIIASPALTTVVDITGLIIYFTIAKLMLGI